MIEPCDFDRISVEELPQARRIASWMLGYHSGKRILDVGCGPGIYVEAMRQVGLDAFGVDNDDRLIESDYLHRVDIVAAAQSCLWCGGNFNVALSLEVGEHIPKEGADSYVSFISQTGVDTIYFSAARPGQGGEGHINLQPKAYWVEKMHRAGFWLDPDATEAWLGFMRSGPHMGWLAGLGVGNGMIFKRG